MVITMAEKRLAYPLGKVRKLNSMTREEAESGRDLQKLLNGVGLVVRLRCSRLKADVRCMGNVKRIKGKKLECQKCGSIWLLG